MRRGRAFGVTRCLVGGPARAFAIFLFFNLDAERPLVHVTDEDVVTKEKPNLSSWFVYGKGQASPSVDGLLLMGPKAKGHRFGTVRLDG